MTAVHRSRGLLASLVLLSTVLVLPLLALPLLAAEKPGSAVSPKTLVTDGSFVHDVGELHMNITNFGLIGSQPGFSAPFSDAPSAEWPAGSRVEHLYAAGLWIGAILEGQPRVSEGAFAHEFMSDPDDPLDTLYRQMPGERGSLRYPDPGSDDDHDGLEDEDPINGRDDDGDGIMDEDAGGIGNQHFRCVMRDDTALASEIYPDHSPLGLQIEQQSFQWVDDQANDFVGVRYLITNDGDQMLEAVELGIFMDPDVGVRGTPDIGADDLVGFFSGHIRGDDGSFWPISVAYGFDADGDGGAAESYFGVMLLGQGKGPSFPLPAVGSPGMWAMNAEAPFDRGGDPTNDAERYQLLSEKAIGSSPALPADWRVLVSGRSLPSLAPGERVALDLAFVAGASLQDMLKNAVKAVETHAGQWFDRDRDPSTGVDGKEFHVPWYRGRGEVWGELHGYAHRGRLQLRVEARFDRGELSVVRLERKNLPERRWMLYEQAADKAIFFAMLRDEDRGPWPREYELRLDELVLDELFVKNPGQGRGVTLDAHPVPFNPRVTLSYALERDSEVSLVVFDARGRAVRRLVVGAQNAGPHQIIWDGTDDSGSSLASGVYHAQIISDGERATRRLVLVR